MSDAGQVPRPTPAIRGFQDCPVLGTGLGLRRSLFEAIICHAEMALAPVIHWLEFTPENYMRRGGRYRHMLEQAAERFPMVSHGVSLSIGSTDPWNESYLRDLEALFKITSPPWLSDHLCFSSVDGVYFNDLIPLPRTRETVSHCVDRIRYLQDRFQRPVLIENISQYFQYEHDQLAEAAFIADILEKADCGLLLDVNNAYVNAQNFGDNARSFIGALPLHRVVQIHIAGYHQGEACLIDTHGAAVCDPVWDLLAWTLSQPACRPCGVMLERDNHIPALADLLPELEKIAAVWRQTGQPAVGNGKAAACV